MAESSSAADAGPLLDEARRLFGDAPRPAHFTAHTHCCECAEHDATLAAHSPQTIGFAELGNPGWDPICFVTDAAFRYYFPALVRLALQGEGDTYYLDQWLFHLAWDGPRNRRWAAFSAAERDYVRRLLEWLIEHRTGTVDANFDTDLLLQAHTTWSDAG